MSFKKVVILVAFFAIFIGVYIVNVYLGQPTKEVLVVPRSGEISIAWEKFGGPRVGFEFEVPRNWTQIQGGDEVRWVSPERTLEEIHIGFGGAYDIGSIEEAVAIFDSESTCSYYLNPHGVQFCKTTVTLTNSTDDRYKGVQLIANFVATPQPRGFYVLAVTAGKGGTISEREMVVELSVLEHMVSTFRFLDKPDLFALPIIYTKVTDLGSEELVAYPEVIHVGDEIRFGSEIENKGGVEVLDVRIKWFIDDEQILYAKEFLLSPIFIPPGSTTTKWHGEYWTAIEGVHTVRFVVDPDNVIAELDEDNNESAIEIQVYPVGCDPTGCK